MSEHHTSGPPGDQVGGQAADQPIPRLPRSRRFKLSGPELLRIAIVAGMLAGVLMLRQPCASGVASFVGEFETNGADAALQAPAVHALPTTPRPGGYVHITGDMGEEEIRQKLMQAGVAKPDVISDAGADAAGE